MAGKRKRLSIKDKTERINESEKSGMSTRKLAEKFKVGKTQVTLLLQNKEEVRNLFQKGNNADQKRKFPKTERLAVDPAVFNWFCKARNMNLPISGPIIQAKALEVAQCLGLHNFKASNDPQLKFMIKMDVTHLRYESTFNSNTFGVVPHSHILPITQDSGIFPESHKNYLLYNIGRTEVYAELKYGTKVMWHGVASSITVRPGEKKVLENGGRPYYVTGLQVYNKSDTRAIVHCATEDDKYYLFTNKESGSFDEVKNKLIKLVFGLGIKQIPYIGMGLSGLVSEFWPKNQPSVWEQIQDKVKVLVDEKVLQTIRGILGGDLRYYQERISTLSEEIESGGDPEHLRTHYMNIAQDMIGFENKFKFTSDTPNYQSINHHILPHFSAYVLMKVSFYIIGIRNPKSVGLSEENIKNIKSYATKAVHGDNGANKYIEDLNKSRVDNSYSTWPSEDLYDDIMNVRSYIATQGFEYIKIWNHMLSNPQSADKTPYNDVISYSTLYGRQTPNLIRQATFEQLPEPLTPKLVNGKRNKIEYIEFYIWRINNGKGPARVGGQKIHFANGDVFVTGTQTVEVHTIRFHGSILKKMEVFGRGAIDCLVFHFSKDRVESCGTAEENTSKGVFELDKHHIVSMFIASDNYSLGGQAANISVAYQLNEED